MYIVTMFNAAKLPGTYTNKYGVSHVRGVRNRDIRHALRVAGITDPVQCVTGLELSVHRTAISASMPHGALAPDTTRTPFALRRTRAFAHGGTGDGLWTVTGTTPVRRQIDEESIRALYDNICQDGETT